MFFSGIRLLFRPKMAPREKLHTGTVKSTGRRWFKLGRIFITEAKYNAIKARRASARKGVSAPRKAIAPKKRARATDHQLCDRKYGTTGPEHDACLVEKAQKREAATKKAASTRAAKKVDDEAKRLAKNEKARLYRLKKKKEKEAAIAAREEKAAEKKSSKKVRFEQPQPEDQDKYNRAIAEGLSTQDAHEYALNEPAKTRERRLAQIIKYNEELRPGGIGLVALEKYDGYSKESRAKVNAWLRVFGVPGVATLKPYDTDGQLTVLREAQEAREAKKRREYEETKEEVQPYMTFF